MELKTKFYALLPPVNMPERGGVKTDLSKFYPAAKQIFIALFPYWNSQLPPELLNLSVGDWLKLRELRGDPSPNFDYSFLTTAKVSRYARGRDYHKTIKKYLREILDFVKTAAPGADGKIFIDTSSNMAEKRLAASAGLGKQGKNTLLINENLGSYFFIGGIVFNAEVSRLFPAPEKTETKLLCSNCRLCISACPTGALAENGVDGNKCLARWNTQTKENIPPEFLPFLARAAQGCDICQEVCPHNLRAAPSEILEEMLPLNLNPGPL